MLKLIATIFFIFIVAFTFYTVNVFAQEAELREVITKQPNYKASLIYDDRESDKVRSKVKAIARKNLHYFLEVLINDEESDEENSPENNEKHIKEHITGIIVKSNESAIVLEHKKKVYAKFKLTNREISRLEFIDVGTKGLRILMFDRLLRNDGTKVEVLGSENIQGHDCFKIRATFNFEEAYFFSDNPFIVYAAKDLKNLIIRVEDEQSKELIYALTNISLDEKDFPNSLFEVPKNYKEIKLRAEKGIPYKAQKTKLGLLKVNSKLMGIDPKELDIEVIEKSRVKNISRVKIISRKATSCNSAIFITYALCQMAKARNYKYFTNLINSGEQEQSIYIVGFTSNENADIKTEFVSEYSNNDDNEYKENRLTSVKDFDDLINFTNQKGQNPILIADKKAIKR